VSLTPIRPIPADELARRICVAHHPHLGTVSAQVPCGPHLQAARNVYGLVTESGTLTFEVVAKARNEAGLEVWGDEIDVLNDLAERGLPPFAVNVDETTDIEGAPA
jgi:hypothetical protein